MGYETLYELEWTPRTTETDSSVAEYIAGHCNMSYALETTGLACQSCKWYDHVEDLVAMSKKFPGVTFHLAGEGEESGDIWDAYALDGKVQKHKAKVVRVESPDPGAWK